MNTRAVCGECGHYLEKQDGVYEKPKFYHTDCYAAKMKRKELCDYICKIFNLKAPGPANYKMRKNFLERGYTDEGILNTLRYIYEIKKISPKGADERIGLVPTYYSQAQVYWRRQEEIAQQAAKTMKEAIENAQKEVLVVQKKTIQKETKLVNPMDWWEEED
jgi:hypothetical protein